MARYLILLSATAVLLCLPVAVRAQTDDEVMAPAHVSFVDGTATLEREGRLEKSPLNMPLLSGDRLRTEDGRLEVLFADGSTLHLDSRTTVDIASDDLLRLIDGRVRINILGVGSRRETLYRIDSPAGSARLLQPGAYRIELLRGPSTELTAGDEPQLELAVLRGAGEIFTDQGTTSVRAGERAYASAGMLPSYAYTYNSAAWDSFDRWSESRRDVALGASAEYLPSDLQTYSSTFDEYGDWQYMQPYGYVWYPRVGTGWRPYYYGRWMPYSRFGWTWVGVDRFSWPTHHYGRWGFRSGVWFWIPSRRWAPAYVSWAYAPGYVSWCPLGFDDRPVIGIDLYRVGPDYYSPWRAWTVVSYADFGRPYSVHDRAVRIDRLDANRRPAFTIRQSAPAVRDVAISRLSTNAQGLRSHVEGRGAAPVQYAGTRAHARNLPAEAGSHSTTQGLTTQERPTQERPTQERPTQERRPQDRSTQDRLWLPPSGGRSTPDTAVPRYVNRGDEIIRSQTARPSPPSATTPGRAEQRALPRANPQPPATNMYRTPMAVPRSEPQRAEPRTYEPRAYERRSYDPPQAPIMPAPGREYTREAPPPRVQERATERPAPAPRAEPRGESRPASAPRAEPRGEANRGGREIAQPRRGRGGV